MKDTKHRITCYNAFALKNNTLYSPLHPLQNGLWNNLRQKQEERKNISQHHAPEKECECDIYGLPNFRSAQAHFDIYDCAAITEHWGKIEIHQDGLRSQYALVKAIAPLKTKLRYNLGLYNVGLVTFDPMTLILLFAIFAMFFGLILTASVLIISSSLFLTLGIPMLGSTVLISCVWLLFMASEINHINTKRKIKTREIAERNNIVYCENLEDLKKYHIHTLFQGHDVEKYFF